MRKNSFLTRLVTITSSAAIAGMLVFTGIASAHVTVKPAVSAPGAWETYTMKVPSEKEIPTTKVTLKVPESLSFKQYQPLPGWKVTTNKNDAGEITTVTWEAESGGIEAGQFQQFVFVGQNPDQDSELNWDALQYYSDGSIVEWTGEEGSELPHSITLVSNDNVDAAAASADHGHDSPGTAGTEAGTETDSTGTSSDAAATDNNAAEATDAAIADTTAPAASNNGMQITTLIIAIAALIAGIGAWVTAARKR